MSPERPSYLLLLPLYLDCGHRGTVKEPVCELPVESNWKEEGSFFLGCSKSWPLGVLKSVHSFSQLGLFRGVPCSAQTAATKCHRL